MTYRTFSDHNGDRLKKQITGGILTPYAKRKTRNLCAIVVGPGI